MTRPVESDVSCVCLVLWADPHQVSTLLLPCVVCVRRPKSLCLWCFLCFLVNFLRLVVDLSCLALSRCQRRDLLRPRILRGFRCRSGRILLLLQSLTNFVGTSPGPRALMFVGTSPFVLWARAPLLFVGPSPYLRGHEPLCWWGTSLCIYGHEPFCWWARALMLVGTSPYVVYC